MKQQIDPDTTEAERLRSAGRDQLAEALIDGRGALLRLFDAYRAGLGDPDLRVPCSPELNLPLWELGHIGWFEEFWIARTERRREGADADPEVPRPPALLPEADTFYNSSRVAHGTRWQLPLPDAARTLDYLAAVRERTLALLADSDDDDAGLYFFRLALFHEAMHREAWIYMAQTLDIPLAIDGPRAPATPGAELALPGGRWTLGSPPPGFAFDNELAAHAVDLAPFRIDGAPVTWRRYLPFVESGAYDDPQYWSAEGWAWRRHHGQPCPRHLRRREESWQARRFGAWRELEADRPALHLSHHEAQAWCAWAGRRLASEAEWEMAACSAPPGQFDWGEVWEWTASPFSPYPGFAAHPYRDYSAPWFDGRPVLRGGSFATAAGMKHPRYRNFFTAERNDIFAGFRSCAI
jgi:ergothioneine biosynthesis protein EgtB